MIVTEAYSGGGLSVRRLAKAAAEPVSTVGRWVGPERAREAAGRKCPVSGDASLRSEVSELCDMPRHRTYGYRRIWALLRRKGHKINRETVRRMMRQMGLSRPKIRHKPKRPKRVEKMRPGAPNRGWQIDMTSFNVELYDDVVFGAGDRLLHSQNRRLGAGTSLQGERMGQCVKDGVGIAGAYEQRALQGACCSQ